MHLLLFAVSFSDCCGLLHAGWPEAEMSGRVQCSRMPIPSATVLCQSGDMMFQTRALQAAWQGLGNEVC